MIDNASGRAGSAFDVAAAVVRAGADPFGPLDVAAHAHDPAALTLRVSVP
jgi:hypothetical protein